MRLTVTYMDNESISGQEAAARAECLLGDNISISLQPDNENDFVSFLSFLIQKHYGEDIINIFLDSDNPNEVDKRLHEFQELLECHLGVALDTVIHKVEEFG